MHFITIKENFYAFGIIAIVSVVFIFKKTGLTVIITYHVGQIEVALYVRREYEPNLKVRSTASPRDNSENYTRVVAQPGVDLPTLLANYLQLMLESS